MSYVRLDDDHEGGLLSMFRHRLSAESRVQTGGEFPIFQDREDIAWGENWKARIEQALDGATLLIPIITPSFFRSPACREEVARFLGREQQLGRDDLILPVYYVSTPEIDDPVRRIADDLATILASRQYADWRELRFEPFTSPLVRKALAQLASRIRDCFWLEPAARWSLAEAIPAGTAEAAASEPPTADSTVAGEPSSAAKHEPACHVVDARGRGDHSTIGAAITAAHAGDRILVRPGVYQEGLVIDKPLELLGDGPVEEIEVRASGRAALVFRANIGRIAHLTLRQAGGEGRWYAVDITQGRLELERCDISSESLSCVAIRNGADPRLRQNRIHHGKDGSGISIYGSALGTLEDNEINSNAYAGVSIAAASDPTLRRNQIHHNQQTGILISDNSRGRLEDNDVNRNVLSGIEIRTGGNPTLRRNQIHENKQSGIYVQDAGLGIMEDNDIRDNELVGVSIRTFGNPTVRRNRINRNRHEAIWVRDHGRGIIEENDLSNNAKGPWRIAMDCEPYIQRARNSL
jgi:F-box protein 11